MEKFAITLTKENDRKVLYIGKNKEETIKKGEEMLDTLSKSSGILSCIQANFDNENNIIDNKYKLIKSWI